MKKNEKPGEIIAIHTIGIENRLKIYVFLTVNSNMNHIRYMFRVY